MKRWPPEEGGKALQVEGIRADAGGGAGGAEGEQWVGDGRGSRGDPGGVQDPGPGAVLTLAAVWRLGHRVGDKAGRAWRLFNTHTR